MAYGPFVGNTERSTTTCIALARIDEKSEKGASRSYHRTSFPIAFTSMIGTKRSLVLTVYCNPRTHFLSSPLLSVMNPYLGMVIIDGTEPSLPIGCIRSLVYAYPRKAYGHTESRTYGVANFCAPCYCGQTT